MMFSRHRVLLPACALLAALGGCREDSATQLSVHAPDFSLSGSPGITASIARDYRVVPDGGDVLTHRLADTTIYTSFVAGWAHADSQIGVTSAVGVDVEGFEASPFRHSKEVVFYDSTGARHTMFVEVEPDGPPTLQRHYREGILLAERTQSWSQVVGGWIHDGASITLYHDEGTVYANSRVTGNVLASAPRSRSALATVTSLPARVLAPKPLSATQLECAAEFFEYLAAMGLVDLATAWVLSQPWNPQAWAALIGAVGAMSSAWDALTDCLVDARPPLDAAL